MAYADNWQVVTVNASVNESLMCASSDLQYCYFHASNGNEGIYKSDDYGQTYTRVVDFDTGAAAGSSLMGLCCSSTGQYVYAKIDPGVGIGSVNGLYISDDYGVTWSYISETTIGFDIGNGYDQSICCSADGSVIYYIGADGSGDTAIIKSSDGGANWSAIYSNVNQSLATSTIACSSDGGVVLCTNYILSEPTLNNGILSTNGGSSFTAIPDFSMSYAPWSCGMSSNGQVLWILDQSNKFHYSLNQGSSWSTYTASDRIANASVSGDGTKFFVGTFDVPVETSIDAGFNWDIITPSGVPYGYYNVIVQNSDGSKLIMSSSGDPYYSPVAVTNPNLFLDGFDYYEADRLPLKWQNATNLTITANGRGGGGCLEPLAGAYTLQSIALDAATATVGFAYYLDAYKDMKITLGGATVLFVDGVISISADGGTTTEASSSSAIPLATWKYVEICVSADTCTVYVSNSVWVSAAITTSSVADVSVENVDSDTAEGSWRIDHLHIIYGNGIYRLGPSKINVVEAVSDSTPQDWTPSATPAYEQVADWPGDISTADTVQESRFTLGTIPAGMLAAQVNAYGTGEIAVSAAVDSSYSTAVALGDNEALLRYADFWTEASEIAVST